MLRAIFLSLLLIPVLTLAQDAPLGFKGVPLGASQADLRSKHGNFRCHETICTWSVSSCAAGLPGFSDCIRSATYGGVTFQSVDATFYEGRMGRVMVFTSPTSFDRLKDSLVEALGKPSKIETFVEKTRAGVELQNERYRWVKGDAMLTLMRYAATADTGSVTIMSGEAAALEDAARRKAVSAGAKDL